MPLQLLLQVGDAGQQCVRLGRPSLVHLLYTLLPGLQERKKKGYALGVFEDKLVGKRSFPVYIAMQGLGVQCRV